MVVHQQLKRINVAQLCRDLEIDRMNLEHWRTNKTHKGRWNITQYDVWRVIQKLGLRIDVKISYVDTGNIQGPTGQ